MSGPDPADPLVQGPVSELDPRYRLDPARFPRRLDLTLNPELLDRLKELAVRSGRSVEEIAAELIDEQCQDHRA